MVNTDAIKEATKRVLAAHRKVNGREARIEAKREDIAALDAQVREAKDHVAMKEAMTKLNRAHAALDRIIETGHTHEEELGEALDKLQELAGAERAKL